MRSHPWSILLGLGGIFGLLFSLTQIRKADGDPILCVECVAGGHHHHASEGISASRGLGMLLSGQADFRANDRDGDGKNQFWRADIAGLYALAPGGGPAIKLIPLSVAAADERSLPHLDSFAVRSACYGYWYRPMRHSDEDPKALSPDRFAFCAYPDSSSAGTYLYVVDENRGIYRSAANGRRGIEVFPTEEELRTSWERCD